MALDSGKYYVGDLCYVLKEQHGFDWDDVLNATGCLGLYRPGTTEEIDPDETTGYFTYKGVKFFSSKTAYGDGTYRDQRGREYWVDAGLIGAFPLDQLGDKPDTEGGQVVDFAFKVSCRVCDEDGVIQIGDLRIDTDPAWDEDDDWGDEDEDEDGY